MQFKQLVDKSRSHREFDGSVRIPHDMIEKWILNASHCPSAMNMQALKYRIVDEENEVASLLPLTRWGTALPDRKLPPVGHGPSAFIVLCHDNSITPLKPIFMIDVGICAQTIMLSAAEDGFGGCMIGSASADAVKELLSLGEELDTVLVLGLGMPEDVVRLVEFSGSTKYYRDAENVHFVPKRSLEEIII